MRTLVLGAAASAAIGLWCFTATSASDPVNPNLSPEARQVFKYLEATYEKKVLAGYNVCVHTPDDYEQTGKQAAIWGRDIQWLDDVKEVAEHAAEERIP